MGVLRDLTLVNPSYVLDRDFYDSVQSSERHLKDVFVIPPFSGRGFIVKKGQTFRIKQESGPQVAEVAIWNAHNPKEKFAAMRNRLWEGLFISTYTRLWSEVPWLRPMMTCIEDTVVTLPPGGLFHHHRFWTHCSPESIEMRSGQSSLNACRINFLQAVQPFGLTEDDLDANIVLFQKVRIDPDDGQWYGAASEAKRGDYVGFYAEMDLLIAVSTCPSVDSIRPWYPPEDDSVRPLGIEIYQTNVSPKEHPSWTDWRPEWSGKWVPPKDP